VIDGRFIGRVVEPFELELQFAAPLDGRPVVLVLDGWVEYPYSQTMFAAWQAGRSYRPITIEARDVDGTWQVLHEDLGYPAGMPRTSVFPLAGLPTGADAIRLRTDLELYVDAVRVADIEPCHAAVVRSSPVSTAILEQPGYPNRIAHPQRRPEYDWADRSPFWDTRVQRGEYTRLGDVRGLVSAADGGVAVFGAGEAIRCRFDPDPPLPSGWTRSHVLDLRGWCKDMDLMTRQGETVVPIPGSGGGEALRTRHRSGR
jgi:hypothetical protein